MTDAVPPSFRVVWRESHATSAVVAAILASIPASLISAAVMAATDHVLGRPPTTTLLRIGDLVPLGDTTREGLVAVALLIHATVGIGWGATWGILVAFTAHHLAPAAGAFWGAIYGLAAWFVSFFLVLPWIHGELVTHTPARVSILWHATYGAVLGALFHFARIRERERHRITETT